MPNSKTLSRKYRPMLWLLTVTLISLAGCSLQPVKPQAGPIVIQCQPPKVDRNLMVPPKHQAIDQLLTFLGLPPLQLPSAAKPSSSTPPSN